MAKKINIDQIPGLTDAIELTVGGREFTVANMKKELLDQVTKLGEDADAAESVHDVLAEQLRILVGGGDDEKAHFISLDARSLKAAVTRVLEELTEAGERKGGRKGGRR